MARSTKPEDSLDLLLDTMCNAFGGIIMIAILVALLIKDTKQAEKGPSDAAQASLVQRKLKQARDDLENTQKFKDRLEKTLQQSGEAAKQVQERDALKRQVEDAIARATAAESLLKSAPEKTEGRLKKDTVENQKAAAQREIAELEKKAKELSEKLAELEKALSDARAKRTIELGPPPVEQDTTKSPFNIIFRHNRLYPLFVPGPGGVVKNETTLRWTPLAAGDEVEPIVGTGIDAEKNEAALRDFIAALRKINASLDAGAQLYVASYVYKDSFPAYLTFKKHFTLAKTGIDQGWQPAPNDDNLRFGESGFKPKKQ